MRPLQLTLSLLTVTLITLTSSAGNYTWTGTTSSDWATSTNWSPNGVPSTGDTASIVSSGNDPVLDGARTLTQIAINSGTLDLNGYTLTYTSKGLFYAGTITNGKIACSGGIMAHYAGAILDCKVSTIASGLGLNGSVFTDSVRIEYTGTSTIFTAGGNKFHGYAEIVNNGSNPIYMAGQSPYNPDSAFADIRFVNIQSVAHNGTGHYFGQKVTLEYGGSTYHYVGRYGTATFNGDIEIDASSSSTHVYFGTEAGTGNNQLADGSQISSIGSSVGWLNLDRFTYLGKAEIDWPSSVFLNNDAVFEDTVNISCGAVVLNGAWFKDTTSIQMSQVGAIGNGSGGNIFDGPTSLSSYGGGLESANSMPDTFNNTLWLNCLGGNIGLGLGCTGTLFNGNINLKGKGGNLSLGEGVSSGLELADGYTINIDTFNTDGLYFRGFVQLGDTPQDLQLTGNAGTYFSHDATFNGKLYLVTPSIYLNGGIFNDTTNMEKTGAGILNNCNGNNHFNGPFTFVHDGATRMAVLHPDSFNAPATFVHNNYQLHLSYGAGNYYGDKVYLKTTGSSSLYVDYTGSSTFADTIFIANNSSTGSITFGDGGGTGTIAEGKTIVEHTDGFNTGNFGLRGITKYGDAPMNLDLRSAGKITFGADNLINGNVNVTSANCYLNGTIFNDSLTVERTGAANGASIGGCVFNGPVSITNSGTGTMYLGWSGNATGDDFNDNLILHTTNTGLIYNNYYGNSTYAGHITASGTANIVFGTSNPYGHAIIDGDQIQYMNGSAPTLSFTKLQINKPSGYVRLTRSITVTDSLKFGQGLIKTANHQVIISDNGKVTGVTDSTYIDGKVQKVGNDAFTYPIGKNYSYRPITISAPGNSTDAFTAEYFDENSDPLYSHSEREDTLDYINTAEYWNMSRDMGTSNVSVTISWENIDCGIDDLDSLLVAGWDTAADEWVSWGNGTATGNTTTGTLSSNGTVTDFGAFALGNYLVTKADAGKDIAIEAGDTITIGAANDTNMTYSWTPGDSLSSTTVSNPMAWPDTTTTYYLTVTGENMCDTIDSVTVYVMIVPNDDTPTGANYAYMENKGQLVDTDGNTRPDIDYYNTGGNPAIYLRQSGWSHVWAQIDTSSATADTLYRVDIKLMDTDTTIKGVPMEGIDSKTNFYYAHCPEGITNVPAYKRIVYPEVYENIDMHFYSNSLWYKLYFVIRPGGDPADIKMKYSGVESMTTGCVDSLAYPTPWDTIIQPKAIAYEYDDGQSLSLLSWQPSYFGAEVDGYEVSFCEIGEYDEEKTLVMQIDAGDWPFEATAGNDNLEWSTYYGGGLTDDFYDVETDTGGNVYVAGWTNSALFPTSPGNLIQPSGFAGVQDALILKFDSTGARQWATYYGGTDADEVHAITTNTAGNVYFTGTTASASFPMANNAYDNSFGGSYDAFIVQLNDAGTAKLWSTFYGNDLYENGNGLDFDLDQNLYMVGTASTTTTYQSQTDAYNNTIGGRGLIAKYNPQNNLVWSSVITGSEDAKAVVADTFGNIFVTGQTFDGLPIVNPMTAAYVDSFYNGELDMYITQFNSADTITWSTYYGGDDIEIPYSIAVDNTENVYMVGYTTSSNFPTFWLDGNAYLDYIYDGERDAFIVKLPYGDLGHGAKKWAAYYGGSSLDWAYGVCVDDSSNVYVAGLTNSPDFDTFELTDAYYQGGSPTTTASEAFVLAFKHNGARVWATHLGGDFNETARSITTYKSSELYAVGSSRSLGTDFPCRNPNVNPPAWYRDINSGSGYTDGFISRFGTVQVVLASGIEEAVSENDKNDLLIYPNPNNGTFNVYCELDGMENVEIQVNNIIGQTYYYKAFENQTGTFRQNVNLSNLAKGCYIVNVKINNTTISRKIILQ